MNELAKKDVAELDYLKQLCAIAMQSKAYQNMNEHLMLNIMLTAKDVGISPMKALNGGFYIVNGKVCMSAGLMSDMIRSAGHSMQITLTDDKCTIIGKRKDNGDTMTLEFTMKDAERAGLTTSPTWKKYPKNMLYNRAISTIARMLFSDVIGNSYTSEDEMFDIQQIQPKNRKDVDIDTINIVPEYKKIEQKPDVPEIPIEQLHLAIDVMNCKCALSELQEYVFTLAAAHEKPQSFIITNAMKDDDRIARFIDTFEAWRSKKQ